MRCCPDAYTLAHYATVYREAGPLISNTMLYCGLAGLIDVVLGATLAYIVLRTRLPGRRLVEQVAMSAVAIPGLVLGIGLLRTYYDVTLPFSGESLATFWVHAGDRLCGAPPALCAVGRDGRAAAAPRRASRRRPRASAPASSRR